MARAFKDGSGATYDGTSNKFTTVPFSNFEMYNFGATGASESVGSAFPWLVGKTGAEAFKAMADNSIAGEMRDCGECHVGGGMSEYVITGATDGKYDPAKRESLRSFSFGATIETSIVTAFNALIDIFNPDVTKRGDVVVQDYSKTGVLEMDCLLCHMKDYNWEARKDAVRKGEYDASRAAGARLISGIKDGTTVFYNTTSVKTNASNELVVDLSSTLTATPDSNNCASCHLSQYNVDWKKRGEQWLPGTDVHIGIGCMACHERSDKSAPVVGTEGVINNKLGLCDPAKGGSSGYDALWNKLDNVAFKNCAGCHEPAVAPNFATYGAPISNTAHANSGLTSKIAYDKNGALVSHMDLIDCTACHIRKTFDGGAFVDGTGADAEGRVALHDEQQVAKPMNNGVALYWEAGKLYAANLLTSFFIRDMNGMDGVNNGLDANNDGRNAGMDPLLPSHVNNINIAKGLKAVTSEKNTDGSWVNEAELAAHYTALSGDGKGTATPLVATGVDGGVKQLLGISDPTNAKKLIPKLSFLMVPFKASHNIAPTSVKAWGKGGCSDCHGADKGFYNGAYPVKGNMDGFQNMTSSSYTFRFKSNQVTTYTKVNGLVDVTDSHPNVVTKKGDRTVPVPLLTRFDGPYVKNADALANQTLRNIDRSEVIYETTFQARDTAWYTAIAGSAPAAACSGPTSPFYCALPSGVSGEEMKGLATSTKGWLVKIEVRTAGDAVPANITFRTAQLGKDNAASMTEVFAALPAGFVTNSDFVVTESGGALTFTAVAGKEIRVSPQTDVGPLGLKGKLWIADTIVRPSGSYAGRDAYVGYLNTLSDPVAFGVGVDPVADFLVAIPSSITTATAITLSAVEAQVNGSRQPVGTSTYVWTYTDGTTEAGLDGKTVFKVFPISTGKTGSISFASTGSKIVTLTVNDEEGKQSSRSAAVTVVAPLTMTVSPGTAKVSVSTGFTFGNLPAGTTKLSVTWGDGGSLSYTTGLTLPKNHTYQTIGTKSLKVYAYDSTGAQLGYLLPKVTVTAQ